MASNGLPFIKFFPSDWLSDEKLRLVSVSARGLWIDILCIMAKADRRGYLELALGVPLPMENLARLAGITAAHCTKLVSELEGAGVFSRDGGVIYNRRMVRDTAFRLKCSEAGTRGGGNPALHTFKGMFKGEREECLSVASNVTPKPQRLRGSEAQINLADPAGPGRSRDVLFEALAIAEGSNPKQLTKDGARRVAVALAQIRAVCPELTISEVQRRARVYRSVMPGGTRLTANALAVNWAKCGGDAPVQPSAELPPEPEGWREKLEAVYPGNQVNIDSKPWSAVPDNIRAEVFGVAGPQIPAAEG